MGLIVLIHTHPLPLTFNMLIKSYKTRKHFKLLSTWISCHMHLKLITCKTGHNTSHHQHVLLPYSLLQPEKSCVNLRLMSFRIGNPMNCMQTFLYMRTGGFCRGKINSLHQILHRILGFKREKRSALARHSVAATETLLHSIVHLQWRMPTGLFLHGFVKFACIVVINLQDSRLGVTVKQILAGFPSP